MLNIQTFVFSPFQENTYLIYNETKEAILIDPGCFDESEKNILKKFIEDHDLKLIRLINTHLHLDHIFGNKFVTDTYGIKPEAGKEDEFLIEKMLSQAQMFGLNLSEGAPELGAYIIDGQEIKLGNSIFTAIHVPGHSPGSMAFYSKEDNLMFSGDVLFNGSIGRTDLEQGDYATLIRSIQNRLLPLPDSTVVYSGHGPSTTIADEKKNNPYL